MSLVITGARIALSDGEVLPTGSLVTEGERITEVGPVVSTPAPAEVIDAQGLTLLPGFIDVHVHGGGGADTMDASPEGLRAMLRAHAQHGTTGLLATTMTQSREKIRTALANARIAYEQGASFCPDGAQVLGVHLEGPYISPGKPGAQPREFIRPYDPDEFAGWLTAAGGAIKLITLAPEQPGSDELIRRCLEAGIVVSLGHTDATAQDAEKAISLGCRHATHLFNAMPPIHHRNPGPIPVLLADLRARVELICDGFHVAAEIARMVYAAKRAGELIAITDGIAGAGMGDGVYDLGGQPVTVTGGQALLADGTLAGSVLTMDRAAKNLRDWLYLGDKWNEIACLTSTNAAMQMGWDSHRGQIAPQRKADLVLVDDDLNVHATIVAGKVVYRK